MFPQNAGMELIIFIVNRAEMERSSDKVGDVQTDGVGN